MRSSTAPALLLGASDSITTAIKVPVRSETQRRMETITWGAQSALPGGMYDNARNRGHAMTVAEIAAFAMGESAVETSETPSPQ